MNKKSLGIDFCKTCDWWNRFIPLPDGSQNRRGKCYRMPPQRFRLHGAEVSLHNVTDENIYCGEYKESSSSPENPYHFNVHKQTWTVEQIIEYLQAHYPLFAEVEVSIKPAPKKDIDATDKL